MGPPWLISLARKRGDFTQKTDTSVTAVSSTPDHAGLFSVCIWEGLAPIFGSGFLRGSEHYFLRITHKFLILLNDQFVRIVL